MNRGRRRAQAGLTLLEVLVATAVMAMLASMIWAAFDQTGRLRAHLAERQENDHLARVALTRITRDLRSAFLTLHVNQNQLIAATTTQFVARQGGGNSELDFATFTHRRLRRNSHEGDAAEVGYRVLDARNQNSRRGGDLVRRESARIDTDPLHGGALDVLVPHVRAFTVRFYDDVAQQWIETWDTTQGTGQIGRLPMRARVTLTVAEGDPSRDLTYSTETDLMIQRPLTFGLPIY